MKLQLFYYHTLTIEEYINLKLSFIRPAKYSSPIVAIPSSVPMNLESVVVPSLSSSLVTPGVVLDLPVRGLVVGVAGLVVVVMGLLVVIGGSIVVGRIVVGCVDGVVVVVVVVMVVGG